MVAMRAMDRSRGSGVRGWGPSRRIVALAASLVVFSGLPSLSCGSVPSERLQSLLVQQGFGRRAEGDAQAENYASTGSIIQFFVPEVLRLNPTFFDLGLLAAAPQAVAVDGTIYIPQVGPLNVLGLTETEVGALVSEQMQAFYNAPIRIEARIIAGAKFFFMFGEVIAPGMRPFVGDMTLLDVFAAYPPTPLGNVGKIRVIRADPRNPLIITVNLREIVHEGISTYNINIKENDIIYVPPTFFGTISRFLEKLLLPLNAAVGALFQTSAIRLQYRFLTGKQDVFFGNPWIY